MARHPLASLVAAQVRQMFGRPDYWHIEAGEGKHVDLASPRGYYFDYSARADYPGATDSDGVPLRRQDRGRPVYSPPDVAQFAFGNLELYLSSGNDRRRVLFEKAATRLMNEAEEVPGSFVGWPMPVAPRAFERRLGNGWFSAMSHGECISVLVRAARLFGMDGALELARRALGGFLAPVADGGMLREMGDAAQDAGVESMAFLEEYPMRGRPSMVLNGHVHAMWGIYDLLQATGDASARSLFERCLRGLTFVLDRYDLGYWTRYDLDEGWRCVNPASRHYHRIHVRQLMTLHRMTGDDELIDLARRWESYLDDRAGSRRAYWEKVRFKLLNPDSVVV
ncbi:MAG: D-glucuronyl C5-epimerase family protein [Candidatus Eisenbacteria bacterium]